MHRIETIRFLLKGDSSPHHFFGKRVPLHLINVLTQPRKTFEEIEILAEDIVRRNLLHPLIVVCFENEHCQEYLEVLNLLWQTNYQANDLLSATEESAKSFYILLAGERRYRACRYLQEVGCESCRREFGQGGCYERHFGDECIDVRLCINVSPLEALFIQTSENIHMRVSPHEEARFYNQLFQLVREAEPTYPLSRFAREVGRSEEKIREAVKFCLLPPEIQVFVEKGQLPYGIACEIARLHNLGFNEKKLEWWVMRALTGNYKISEFRELVTNYLRTHNSSQTSLFEIFSQEQRKQLEAPHFRQVVERRIVMALWSWIYYFSRVNTLFLEGKIGKKDSPFSERSPLRIFRRLIEEEKRLLPHLQTFLPGKEYEKSKGTLREAEKLITQLEEVAQE